MATTAGGPTARARRVCVIGAGSSGIPSAKALADRGLEFDVYERSDRVGGNWVFRNRNGMSAAYRSLHINSGRPRMQYADFPMPADYPDFCGHEAVARYFESYVDAFDLRRHIQFGVTVTRATRGENGGWHIETDDGQTRTYDALMVANGHHWSPRGPDPAPPGRFDGIQFHAHGYIDPAEPHDLRGKRVLVVGMGNSAMDIAVELSRPGNAARVLVSARRGAWIVPNYLFGKPVDQLGTGIAGLPFPLRAFIFRLMHRVAVGRLEDFGVPHPDHPPLAAHPTVSSEFLVQCGRGEIHIRRGIERLEGDRVHFVDGRDEEIDAIVWCTGYNIVFPFFDPAFLSAPDNTLPLWLRMVKPEVPDLFFIGLFQPLGAIMPLAEAQAKLAAAVLAGQGQLPSVPAMRAEMDRDAKAMYARYVPSKRHTMQVDFDPFLARLHRALVEATR